MKIMLSFSYRAGLISQNKDHFLQAMVPKEAYYEDDMARLDYGFSTTFSDRIPDLLKVIDDPNHRPEILIMTATRDDLCEEESMLIEEIRKRGIQVIGHSKEVCELCRDKKETKKFLQKINVPVPQEYRFSEIDEADLPVVLKSIDLWEGKGVSIVSKWDEIPPNSPADILIEQYIQGVEMSVQVIRFGDKTIVSPPVYKGKTSYQMVHPLKKTRIFPNIWNAKTLNSKIMNTAKRIAEELQVQGPLDIDLVATNENEFYVLEINSRLSGVSRMICSAGHNVMDMLLTMAEGDWGSYHLPEHGVSVEIPVSCSTDKLLQYQKQNIFDYIYFRNDIETGLPRNRVLVSDNRLSDIIDKLDPIKDELQISEDNWAQIMLNGTC